MPDALVADEMDLGKTFTSVATAILCKMVTEKVLIGLPLSTLWGNTVDGWVIMAHNEFPGIVWGEREWYPLERLNSVPSCLLQIQIIRSQLYAAHMSSHEPILVVTMPGVVAIFKTVINEMLH
jgi:hypothetical protein